MVLNTRMGIRGKPFKDFIERLLSLSALGSKYSFILTEENMERYAHAFTHRVIHADNNYEFYEFIGDATLNKAIVWYLSNRFPNLNCVRGIRVLTRLKINLISRRNFASIAERYGFGEYISGPHMDHEGPSSKNEKILEDVFEAFFGATEMIINQAVHNGIGYLVCYELIESMMNTEHISLKYEDLFDAKTRLKELFDFFGTSKLGMLEYTSEKQNNAYHVKALLRRKGESKYVFLGEGDGTLKAYAEQDASEQAIEVLRSMGFEKKVPHEYLFDANHPSSPPK